MTKLRDIRVVLRSAEGHYVSGGPLEWDLTDDLSQAAVFDYIRDHVEAVVKAFQQSHGLALEAVHVRAHELCETCDRCRESVLPTIAFFTGRQFLCPDCSALRVSREGHEMVGI